MKPKAKLSDLISALETEMPEHVLRFDRQTNEIVQVDEAVLSAAEEGEEGTLGNLPDWQKPEVEIARAILEDDGTRFIDPPDKFEFNEYRQIEKFIQSVNDEHVADQLWRAVRGRGAFRHFKNTAASLGLLKDWYRFRDQRMKQFAIEWAEANGIEYENDIKRTDQ